MTKQDKTRENIQKKEASVVIEAKEVSADDGIVEVVINSGRVDRDNEILDLDGMDWQFFLNTNPVVAAFHRYDQPPIGKFLSIWRDPQRGLMGLIKMAINEYPLARTMYNLIKGGYLRSGSIGFNPFEGEMDDTTGAKRWTKSEMLEYSFVVVPSDRYATVVSKDVQKRLKDVEDGKIGVADFTEATEEEVKVEDLKEEQPQGDGDKENPPVTVKPEEGIPSDESHEEVKDDTDSSEQAGAKRIINIIDKAVSGIKTLSEKAEGLEGREKETALSKLYELSKVVTQCGEMLNATVKHERRQVVKQIRYVLKKVK